MARKSIMIAAHRGVSGGNIPGNTVASAEIALRQGTDILELDVTRSADDVLYVFHPDTERVSLGKACDLRQMASGEIDKLRFVNAHGAQTAHPIVRLEEMLAYLKGRCVVNIDKFGDNPDRIARLVRTLHMQDQVLIKCPGRPELLRTVAEVAYDLPFMPMVYEEDTCFEALSTCERIRLEGVEAVFSTEDAPLASDAYIERIHAAGKKIWVNAILFDDKKQLSAGHTDDVSLYEDPEKGWGWLARKGYDIIQTDWPLPCGQYLRALGY